MAWGTPPDFTVLGNPTAANLDTISADLTYLRDLVETCCLTNSGVQTIPTATWTTITFDGEIYDNAAMHAGGNPSRITAAVAGQYEAKAFGGFEATANAALGARFLVDGTTVVQPGAAFAMACDVAGNGPMLVTQFAMVATTYVELQLYQNKGVDLDTVASGVMFALRRIAA